MSTVSSNGQIVIPAEIRRRLGISEGTKLLILEEGGDLVLKPLREEDLEETFASTLDRLHRAFEEAGLSREEVDEEVQAHRGETS